MLREIGKMGERLKKARHKGDAIEILEVMALVTPSQLPMN